MVTTVKLEELYQFTLKSVEKINDFDSKLLSNPELRVEVTRYFFYHDCIFYFKIALLAKLGDEGDNGESLIENHDEDEDNDETS